MLWPGIKKLGKELNFERTDSEAAGMLKNCFVKLYDGQNIKVLEIYVPNIDADDKNVNIKIIESNNIKKYEWLANGIKIIFQELIRPYPIKNIKKILEEITGYFSNKYTFQAIQCQYCGQQDGTEMFGINNVSMLTCNDCYRQIEKNIQNENMDIKNTQGNYFLGFIGAILFSIPGILAAIIFFVFLNRLAAFSALIYILLGMIGYKKFKGKISLGGAAVVIGAGLLMVGVGTVIAYSANILFLLYKELGEINFEAMFYILEIPEVQGEIRTNLLLSYVISCLFFVFQINSMLKDWKNQKIIKKLREIK
ncbi:MAG: hypothetical protein FWD47_04470 [Treponema sp.]|nr:hypothetical protein [Treponema sp.]